MSLVPVTGAEKIIVCLYQKWYISCLEIQVKKVPAVFYKSRVGNEPVRDWLKSLAKEDRRAIGADIQTVEYGWPVGMPVCKPMGSGIFEVRTDLKNRIARVLFCVLGDRMLLLHGFIKKTRQTPDKDLKLAIQRKTDLEKELQVKKEGENER